MRGRKPKRRHSSPRDADSRARHDFEKNWERQAWRAHLEENDWLEDDRVLDFDEFEALTGEDIDDLPWVDSPN